MIKRGNEVMLEKYMEDARSVSAKVKAYLNSMPAVSNPIYYDLKTIESATKCFLQEINSKHLYSEHDVVCNKSNNTETDKLQVYCSIHYLTSSYNFAVKVDLKNHA